MPRPDDRRGDQRDDRHGDRHGDRPDDRHGDRPDDRRGPPGASAPFVRAVTGDVDPAALGPIDYHEHLFHRSPLLPGEDLDDERAAQTEFASLLACGFAGIVDATPIGLGRRPAALARIAAATGGVIVAATGRHRDGHYRGGWSPGEAWLTRTFVAELTDGMYDDPLGERMTAAPRPARAGLIKLGVDYWSISAAERDAIAAAAAAHAGTGAPIMVHTEYASAGHQLLDLFDAAGVRADRVALAHVDRNPDPALHGELAARGAYLGYDGAARYKIWPESVLLDCLAQVVAAGHGDRVLLGGDVARRSSFAAYGGMPGLAYLGERFVPRVRAAIGAEAAERILVHNPARYLTWSR